MEIRHALEEITRSDELVIAYAMPGDDELTLTRRGAVRLFDPSRSASPELEPESTTRDDYDRAVGSTIARLEEEGGKMVVSRLIAGHSDRPLAEAIADYFERFPATFRFIFREPGSRDKLWFGASPELLADLDAHTHRLATCALAGTKRRPQQGAAQWDPKNMDEHQMVVDFIVERLYLLGLNPQLGASDEVTFGNITHLHTPITAKGVGDFTTIVNDLSPTPALSGFPRSRAMEQIAATEGHSRGYYGGYVAVEHRGHSIAYVNLRSARVGDLGDSLGDEGFAYNVIVGGGITAHSRPASEWIETELKSAPLLASLASVTSPITYTN